MKLVMIKIIFEVLLVPNKRVFRIQVNYVIRKSAHNFGFTISTVEQVPNFDYIFHGSDHVLRK